MTSPATITTRPFEITPTSAPRLWPAYTEIRVALGDGEWRSEEWVTGRMLSVSDCTRKTCQNLIGAEIRKSTVECRKDGKRRYLRLVDSDQCGPEAA